MSTSMLTIYNFFHKWPQMAGLDRTKPCNSPMVQDLESRCIFVCSVWHVHHSDLLTDISSGCRRGAQGTLPSTVQEGVGTSAQTDGPMDRQSVNLC